MARHRHVLNGGFSISCLVLMGVLFTACATRTPPPVEPLLPEPPPAVQPEPRELLRSLPVPSAFREAVERGTRTETGEPGPGYWQQRVDYRMDVELEPAEALLRGTSRIRYLNNSPDTLSTIVLNLYQNVFAPGVPRNRTVAITGGTTVESVRAQGYPMQERTAADLTEGHGYRVDGTIAHLVLPQPIGPGESATLELQWRNRVPPPGTFRTAWEDALGGRAFHVAQWYPQIATYDDLRGWDTSPYLGDGEFHLEYGDFEVSITVPDGWLVIASGELRNAVEVLTEESQQRLADALRTDGVTRVVTAADREADNVTQPSMEGRQTWHFRARDVRDFAFATSDRYVWDVARAAIPDGQGGTRYVPAHALYRPGSPNWERAAEFTRHATELLSDDVFPYAYPQVSVAEGPVFGMEYPHLSFIGKPAEERALQAVIAHEVAHQWIPMMVGTREAAEIWIDEGFASYYDALATEDLYPDEPSTFEGYLRDYLGVAGTDTEVPMTRHTDAVEPGGGRVVAAYRKPALAFRALRHVLGDETFQTALHALHRDWLFRRPSQWDLFNTFEQAAGRDLSWFFYPWFFETGVLHRAIEAVDGAETGDLRIRVRDLGDLPAPVPVVVTTEAGETMEGEIPVDAWLDGSRVASLTLEAPGPVTRVEIDPEQIFPEVDRDGNVWER